MYEITADNALTFCREKGWIAPGPARVEALGGGVSNVVLRVTTREGAFVLKQSRPQLRTRDDWFSDIERIEREQEVMETLRPLLPAGTVPEVLFADRPNYVFAMSHAPLNSRAWKEDLLRGCIDTHLGQWVGHVLGLIHETSATCRDRLQDFKDATAFV